MRWTNPCYAPTRLGSVQKYFNSVHHCSNDLSDSIALCLLAYLAFAGCAYLDHRHSCLPWDRTQCSVATLS